MIAADIMTSTVVAVGPDTPLEMAVQLMIDKRISGLPVVDADKHLVGILTEADLLRRAELGTEKDRPRWLQFLMAPGRLASEYVDTHSRRVGDLMTQPVFSVEDTALLGEIVAIMQDKHVKRVPVTRKNAIVGMVSRADLMRALVQTLSHTLTTTADTELRLQVVAELKRQDWACLTGIKVNVDHGVVNLDGAIMDERERDAVRVVAENVPGVRAVRSNLVWVEPNSGVCFGAAGILT